MMVFSSKEQIEAARTNIADTLAVKKRECFEREFERDQICRIMGSIMHPSYRDEQRTEGTTVTEAWLLDSNSVNYEQEKLVDLLSKYNQGAQKEKTLTESQVIRS